MDKDTYIKQLESEIIELEKCIEEALRHQVVDIPPIEPQVTEYVHIHRCKDCGRLIYRSLPDGPKRKHFGPGTLSVVGILTGGFAGKLVSGYYNAYNFYKLIRLICLAHLKRGFKAISKARGTPGKTGQELYGLAKKVIEAA